MNRFEYANVSIPIAVLIWLMIFPMMMKVDFKSVKNVGKNPKGLFVTWVTNWLIKPFTLYLSLEDTVDRLHLRLSCITEDGSEDTWFATKTDADTLTEQLESFIRSHPDVGLIVIDTFARVRDGVESSYLSDYEEMKKFKELADKHRLALILVHHLRKASDSDPVNMVSGSTGLIGAVDGIYILEKDKRLENKAKLHITGRNTPDMQLRLEFDRDASVWNFVEFVSGEVEDLGESILAAIDKLVEGDGFTGTATELLTAMQGIDSGIDIQPNRLTRLLREKGLVLEKRGVAFHSKRTNHARLLTLERCVVATATEGVGNHDLPQAGDGDDRNAPRG